MSMIDTSKVIAEANASYNAKYIQDCTWADGTTKKVQFWYKDQTGFPRFTNNLLFKHHAIDNAGIKVDGTVLVLKAVNNDAAVFIQYGGDYGVQCLISKPLVFSLASTADVPACKMVLAQSYIRNGSGIQQAMKVTALPTTTSTSTMYVVVPTETND